MGAQAGSEKSFFIDSVPTVTEINDDLWTPAYYNNGNIQRLKIHWKKDFWDRKLILKCSSRLCYSTFDLFPNFCFILVFRINASGYNSKRFAFTLIRIRVALTLILTL